MTDQPVVIVRGEAHNEVDPEIAEFAITVSARDKDRPETLRRLTERLDAVRRVLGEYSEAIEKQASSQLSVYPETKRSEKVTAYVGSVYTNVTVKDFSVLGELMLRLADLDQTSIAGPWWSMRPDSPAYGAARRAAIEDAISRARDYAAALGCEVTGLQQLADAGLGQPETRIMPMARAASFSAGMEATPELALDPARQEVHGAVEARFTITNPVIRATTR